MALENILSLYKGTEESAPIPTGIIPKFVDISFGDWDCDCSGWDCDCRGWDYNFVSEP